jgi:DNA-binding MarR family transcriptional regulator
MEMKKTIVPSASPALPANPTALDYGALPQLAGYRLKKAYAYSVQTFTQRFAGLGLAYGQYSVLVLIALNPGLSQLALAAAAGLDDSTIVPITNRFVELGWIRRRRRREDRRIYALAVTPVGEQILERARLIRDAHEEDLLGPLAPDERQMLLELLAKITDARGSSADRP